MTTENALEASEPCCDDWFKISGYFSWMSFVDEPELLAMPHIRYNHNSWRVNFCPVCGKNIRSTIMHAIDLQEPTP